MLEKIIERLINKEINETDFVIEIKKNKENIKIYQSLLVDPKDIENGKIKVGAYIQLITYKDNKTNTILEVAFTSPELMKKYMSSTPHICAPSTFEAILEVGKGNRHLIINPGSDSQVVIYNTELEQICL